MKRTIKTRILTTIVFLLTISAANAQSPFTFGIKVGLNYSSNVGVDNADYKFGPNIGVTMDIRLTQNIYLLSGLEYSVKGSKGEVYIESEDLIYSTNENPAYIQLPVHVGYMLPVSKEVRLVFHGGPFIAYGVGGRNKREWSNGNKDEIDYFSDAGHVSKFDFGIGLGVNAEYNRFVASLGYDRGLRNFNPQANDGKTRTSNFYFTVGYLF